MVNSIYLLCCVTFIAVARSSLSAQDVDSDYRLFLTGRYEEAVESYASVQPPTVESLLGQARCLNSLGKVEEAIARLQANVFGVGKDAPEFYATLARLHFERGNYAEAVRASRAAVTLDAKQPLANYVLAEIDRFTGRITQADKRYADLAELAKDNRLNKQLDVEDLYWVAQAMTQHARWNRDTQMFDRLVNNFYPRLLEKNGHFWPAHLASGKLFLEKFNDADAKRELSAAIAINPRAVKAHAAMGWLLLNGFDLEGALSAAERALKVNQRSMDALLLTADIAMTNLQPMNAVEPLKLALELNPISEAAIGRTVAIHLRLDGLSSETDQESRSAKLLAEAFDRNPHCGTLLEATGESFDRLRIYPQAGQFYSRAIKRLPQLVSVHGKLGLVQMRLGEEAAARETLEESFEIDPFNVRVKNTLDVLDLLDEYAVLETEHFILRFDRGQDGMLAEYAARYLEEEVYDDIVQSLGYEPPEKTLLEIFSRAKGTKGHSWFSARMVGLPFIGTVGACAGKMFALTSPADGQFYNWARVLRHEFVHVVNLQQTDFLIPHWFTEALAVRNEQGGYPPEWDRILVKYVAEDRLFDLSNINHGFVRPGNSERWTLAYFQAYLYADLIESLGGDDALAGMLRGYAAGKSTDQVLQDVLQQPLDEFEKKYKAHLTDRVATSSFESARRSAEALREVLAATPDDVDALAEYSILQLEKSQSREARISAQRVLSQQAAHPLARYTMARLMFSIGEDEKAWKHIRTGLDEVAPHAKLLELAARLSLEAKRFEDAEKYYSLGADKFPNDFSWTKGLTRLYLATSDRQRLFESLAKVAEREADKTVMARKLTQLALINKDFAAAEYWANRMLHVDVMNPIAHAELAKAFAQQGKRELAMRELKAALKLSPEQKEWVDELARLQEEVEIAP